VYTFSAKITTNGPVKVKYHWEYSDGGVSETDVLVFEEAGTKTVSNTWSLRTDAASVPRSASIFTTSPMHKKWGEITFTHTCN
jgi:hypothetical protein